MKETMNILAIILATIALTLACVNITIEQAEAAPLSTSSYTYGITSVPCVTDIEHTSGDKYLVEVTVAGHTNGKSLTVKKANRSKKLRTYKLDDHTWSFEAKRGTRYIISFNSKSIEYKIRSV